MSSNAAWPHLEAAVIADIAAGRSPDHDEAAHLGVCAECRRALVALDPSALFSLLNALPPTEIVPAPPRFAKMSLPTAASIRQRELGLARRRAGWIVAAAVVLGVAGLFAVRDGAPPAANSTTRRVARHQASPRPAVVERVYSEDSARVVTVVPPDEESASFTLILDAGIDL
ncbi:MAG: hypothetical protein U0V87_02030 [Acidobacteriota bacterium]